MDVKIIKKTHFALKKYLDWPIPYWVSPLGIFVISAIFWLYDQAYDYAMPSTVHWVLDKTVYLGGILAAALIAQHIFNKNALNRENRERRIKKIEEVSELLPKLRLLLDEYFATCSKQNDQMINDNAFEQIMDLLQHVYTYQYLYYPSLKTSDKIKDKLSKHRSSAETLKYRTDSMFAENRDKVISEEQALRMAVTANLTILPAELALIHQEIEAGKYNSKSK